MIKDLHDLLSTYVKYMNNHIRIKYVEQFFTIFLIFKKNYFSNQNFNEIIFKNSHVLSFTFINSISHAILIKIQLFGKRYLLHINLIYIFNQKIIFHIFIKFFQHIITLKIFKTRMFTKIC